MRFNTGWLKKTGSTLLGLSGVTAVLLFSGSAGLSQWCCTAVFVSAGLQQPAAGMSMLADSLTTAATAPSTTTSSAKATASAEITTAATRTTAVTQTVPAQAPPGEKGDGGKLLEQTLTPGSTFVNHVAIRNKSRTEISLEQEANAPLEFRLSDEAGPKVLIVHTHTTESYMLYDAGYYNSGDAERSKDESLNVCAVGEAVAAQLKAAGIEVIHDTTIHDHPQYQGAYTRSQETVKKNLEQYPTIQVVLDLHRDCIMKNDTDKVKPTTEINGKKAAQIMMVMGVTSTESSPHPNWKQNLHFAMALQRSIRLAYPELARPISLTNTRYNQHLSTGYLLVEMGSDGNTLEEAVYSGQLLGQKLAEVMISTKETP